MTSADLYADAVSPSLGRLRHRNLRKTGGTGDLRGKRMNTPSRLNQGTDKILRPV